MHLKFTFLFRVSLNLCCTIWIHVVKNSTTASRGGGCCSVLFVCLLLLVCFKCKDLSKLHQLSGFSVGEFDLSCTHRSRLICSLRNLTSSSFCLLFFELVFRRLCSESGQLNNMSHSTQRHTKYFALSIRWKYLSSVGRRSTQEVLFYV